MDRTQSSMGILPGGCIPDDVLPAPWPPPNWPPAEPEPDDLAEPVDWMSYPHEQLYEMVHQGLDLATAGTVAGQWGHLADSLDEIGNDLRKALEQSADGWQGNAAETARQTMQRLADWTTDTAERGKDVSTCVSRQAELAEHARNRMPRPVRHTEIPYPLPDPQPMPAGGQAAQPVSAMTAGGYASAPNIVADPVPDGDDAQQAHQEAAEVMRRFQEDSLDVHRDVPSFVSPTARAEAEDTDEGDDEPPDSGTSTSSTGGSPATGGVPGTAPGPGGASGTVPPGTGTQQPGTDSPRLGTAGRSGAVPTATGASGASGSATSAGSTRGAMGGMPMGAAGGGSKQGGDTEHKVAEYLEEDSDIFAPSTPVVPPVIGAEPPRRGHPDTGS